MTIAHRLKLSLVEYLMATRPSSDLAVVDATQAAEMDAPVLGIEVGQPEAHSVALAHVQRCPVEIRLRLHAGDAANYDANEWIGIVEEALDDPEQIKLLVGDMVRIDYWLYGGAAQEWDDSIIETTFTAECLCSRI